MYDLEGLLTKVTGIKLPVNSSRAHLALVDQHCIQVNLLCFTYFK